MEDSLGMISNCGHNDFGADKLHYCRNLVSHFREMKSSHYYRLQKNLY